MNKTNYITFFINDYKNSETMLTESIKSLMQGKYNDHHVYLQNFSKFEGVFLLKIIANLDGKVKFLIRDNNLIKISVTFDIKNEDKISKCIIHFQDSLLLLPSSLAKLAINFGVESKGSFDFSKLNLAKTPQQLNQIRHELLDYNKKDCLILDASIISSNVQICTGNI